MADGCGVGGKGGEDEGRLTEEVGNVEGGRFRGEGVAVEEGVG